MATIREFRSLLENIEGAFFVKGSGCANCQGNKLFSNPGLKGRVLAAEVILPDRETCSLLAADREFEARRLAIVEAGTPTIALHGFQLLKDGRIGVEEFMNAIARPGVLRDDLLAEEERRRNEGSARGSLPPERAVAE